MLTAAIVYVLIATSTTAQTPFSPPPPPQLDRASVRGLAPSITSSPSPANIVPQPSEEGSTAIDPLGGTIDGSTSGGSSRMQPVEGGQIVARVDGQIILASDVLWQVDQLIAANRDRIPPEKIQEAKRALLRQQVMGLIDSKILYADFRRKVPAENLPMIQDNLAGPFEEQEIPRLLKMLKLKNRNELDALFRKSETSIADVQRQFNERTIAGEWLRQMVPKPKEITHEQMLEYYNEHRQDFEYSSQAKWEELVVRFDRVNGDREAAWIAITGLGNEVWQRVSKQPGLRGPVFKELAKQRSHGFNAQNGGQHEWTTKGSLLSEDIDKALFSLKVGQLSNVIETENGFHIVRVLERKEAGRTPFTEAQTTIREALTKDQRKGLAEAELAKIRKNSRVWTIFDGDISGPILSQKLGSTARR